MEPSLSNPLMVQVSAVSAEARDVLILALCALDGSTLPSFGPGAHIELKLPNGLIKHYSLINDGNAPEHYLVAVGLAAESRGGSAYLHGSVCRGTQLAITGVRNNFQLDPDADAYLFIAGGIGITPIMSMIRWCRSHDRRWRLIYAARSRQRAAFYEDLKRAAPEQVDFHFDDELGGFLDVGKVLAGRPADEQIYCCGPEPLMKAVESATSDRPEGAVHFEWFTAPENSESAESGSSFQVELRSNGRSLDVPTDKSILQVLEENGLEVPFSCREGLCRTCETRICEGEPDHRDYVLSAEERAAGASMMICVSRAKSEKLVLDL